MNICLIGAPGVGKGTFSKLLVKKLGLIHISIGDIIRKEVENKSAAGIRVRNYVEDGLLIPDGIVNDIVLQKLQKYTFSNILLDGFPRNVKQAEFVNAHMPDLVAVHVTLRKDIAVEKLLGRRVCSGCGCSFNLADICRDGYHMPAIMPDPKQCPLGSAECSHRQHLHKRSDDTSDTIMKRFEIFETETAPVIHYYEEKQRLKSFDVKKGVDDIGDLITTILS